MSKSEYLEKALKAIHLSNYPDVEKFTMGELMKLMIKENKTKTSYADDITENFIKVLHNEAVTDNRNLRKLLSLPIKKEELRYMEKGINFYIPHQVESYCIAEWYTESNSASLEITLVNGSSFRILGDYFSHMQKPSFEKDMISDSLAI